MNLPRLFRTVRYLTITQIYFQVYYKVLKMVRRALGCRYSYSKYKKGNRISFLAEWIEKPTSYKGDSRFSFLNTESKFAGVWDDAGKGDLWRYNLNYMDYLLQENMSAEQGLFWIDNFIQTIGENSIAEDPYPISLRGINWIKFVTLHYDQLTEEQLHKIDTSLYSQYRVLYHNTERHLMANHYLENGCSLLFAACYFEDDVFFGKAEKIVLEQLEEQILSDGAHFELSPMYHCVILDRLLDCYNILLSSKYSEFASYLYNKIVLMLQWLDSIEIASNQLPLFNDSANGIAPAPSELREYADRLNIEWGTSSLKESGYRRWVTSNYQVVVDVAQLGPSYNLGHSHADTFNFVMNIADRPFVVDTGTSVYAAGKRRDYERSTKAHNTVCIDGKNSSAVWGAFRCAERATVTILSETDNSITARHNGYKSIGIECERQYICSDDCLEIIDTVKGGKHLKREARIHFAEDVHILEQQDNRVVTSYAVIEFDGAMKCTTEDIQISREFGLMNNSKCLSVIFSDRLVTRIIPELK